SSTIGWSCPQQGCSGFWMKLGGVGSQGPGTGLGTYGQLLKSANPSEAAHARIASATLWPWTTERWYSCSSTSAWNWAAKRCSTSLMASKLWGFSDVKMPRIAPASAVLATVGQ